MNQDTDEQKLALAIRLWMHFHQCTDVKWDTRTTHTRLERGEAISADALRMAELTGCRKEFLESLAQVPVFAVTFKDLEAAPKRKGIKPCSAKESGTKRFRKSGGQISRTVAD